MKYVALLLLTGLLAAQKTPALTEVSQLRLLTSYQTAVILQLDLYSAQGLLPQKKAAADRAAVDYSTIEAAEAKADGFPVGTTFTVDVTTKIVTVVPPPPAPPKTETKPEKKKE